MFYFQSFKLFTVIVVAEPVARYGTCQFAGRECFIVKYYYDVDKVDIFYQHILYITYYRIPMKICWITTL